ncbi:MAG: hypothetical protein K6E85_04685 [Lachnospiraceae bacterium]|nr:hypothetical protein [Lachnospiraceae bacterium]
MTKINFKISFGYAFIHFAMEVLCFFFLYRVFSGTGNWWTIALVYDAVAFAGQVPVGAFCEKHPRFKPGVWGVLMLTLGAAIGLVAAESGAGTETVLSASGATTGTNLTGLAAVIAVVGFVILTVGNALLHISGALVTLRVSEGRLSEPGIFVGGGAFGVITGRLLGSGIGPVWIPFVLMAAAFILVVIIDRAVRMVFTGSDNVGAVPFGPVADGTYDAGPDISEADISEHEKGFFCLHDIAADRPAEVVILILAGVIMVRSYIGNGIPMQWKKTAFAGVILFVVMGVGKMAGGVLADLFGPRRIGVVSCILAVPFLLLGNNLMWVSLIGILLFSMTMAIALGGIVSVIRNNPGIAFGITTLALFLGSLPIFFFPMPKGSIMNILLALLSVLSAAGIYFTVKDR